VTIPLSREAKQAPAVRQRVWPRRLRRHLLWLVAVLLLALTLRAAPLAAVASALGRLDGAAILLLALANAVVLITLSGRWWLMLKGEGYSLPYLSLVGHRLAVFALSYLTPGPQFGGEPLQVVLLERKHSVARAPALAAAALDRLLELLVNFGVLLAGVLVIWRWRLLSNLYLPGAAALTLGIVALLLLILLALAAGWRPASRLLRLRAPGWFSRRWPAALAAKAAAARRDVAASEDEAQRLLRRSPAAVGGALLVSLVSWAALVGEYWLMVYLLGQPLSLLQLITALTAARLAFLLPIPGGLGALEASQMIAFGALGLDPALGLAAALVIRARDLALGGLGLWWGVRALRSALARSGVGR
jgi:glycosyltransferase 2 family protein